MDAMQLWEDMGNTIVSWYKKDEHLYLFVENGDVKGYAKTNAGRMWWKWPDKLMEQKES